MPTYILFSTMESIQRNSCRSAKNKQLCVEGFFRAFSSLLGAFHQTVRQLIDIIKKRTRFNGNKINQFLVGQEQSAKKKKKYMKTTACIKKLEVHITYVILKNIAHNIYKCRSSIFLIIITY